jgi:plastocyanin
MTHRRATATAIAALAATGLAGAAVVTADAATRKIVKPKTYRVQIGDNFYLPLKLRIRKYDSVRWVWPSDTGDTHDVKLGSRPKGVKVFQSDPAAVGFVYKRKFTVKGTYKIICTFHDDMKQTIVVR